MDLQDRVAKFKRSSGEYVLRPGCPCPHEEECTRKLRLISTPCTHCPLQGGGAAGQVVEERAPGAGRGRSGQVDHGRGVPAMAYNFVLEGLPSLVSPEDERRSMVP